MRFERAHFAVPLSMPFPPSVHTASSSSQLLHIDARFVRATRIRRVLPATLPLVCAHVHGMLQMSKFIPCLSDDEDAFTSAATCGAPENTMSQLLCFNVGALTKRTHRADYHLCAFLQCRRNSGCGVSPGWRAPGPYSRSQGGAHKSAGKCVFADL